jgi:2-methylcitrate dehydratase PrpD
MITWMQRHKKWLVITIWISTIAFVGAGFVGWGSYDYGKNAKAVAVVGNREISVEEFQEEYSNLYAQYSKMFGTMFSKELADQLNLKDAAYRQVLQKNLILAYADSIGFDVTDEDVAKELVKYNVFLKDGKEVHIFVKNAIGSVENPMSDANLEQKFTSLAEPIIGKEKTRQLIAALWKLGQAPDLKQILSLCTPD